MVKLVFSKIVLSVVSLDNSGKHCLVIPFNFSTMHWFKNQARFSRVFHYFFSLKGTLLTDIKLKSVWTPLLLQKSSDTLSSSNIISITGLFSFQIMFCLDCCPSIEVNNIFECAVRKLVSMNIPVRRH